MQNSPNFPCNGCSRTPEHVPWDETTCSYFRVPSNSDQTQCPEAFSRIAQALVISIMTL